MEKSFLRNFSEISLVEQINSEYKYTPHYFHVRKFAQILIKIKIFIKMFPKLRNMNIDHCLIK